MYIYKLSSGIRLGSSGYEKTWNWVDCISGPDGVFVPSVWSGDPMHSNCTEAFNMDFEGKTFNFYFDFCYSGRFKSCSFTCPSDRRNPFSNFAAFLNFYGIKTVAFRFIEWLKCIRKFRTGPTRFPCYKQNEKASF